MTLAIILIVLLIDRLLWQGDPLREHRWFDRYTDRLFGLATGQWLAKKEQGAFWVLLPPLLIVVILQWLAGNGNFANPAISIAILLFALGPRELGRCVKDYLDAQDRGNTEDSNACALVLAGPNAPDDEPRRALAVASGLLRQALARLFAPIFWFVLLGPLGAALYRLAQLTAQRSAQHGKAPARLAASAERLVALLDWLPARLTAAAYAAAGNFDSVWRVWRAHHGDPFSANDAEQLLTQAGEAALESWPDEEEINAGEPIPIVEDALALIWRSLAVWLLALLILTLTISI